MKRPLPEGARPGRHVRDIKSAYTTEQLAEIGAIALTWNQVKLFVDFLLLIVLKMPVGLWTAVTDQLPRDAIAYNLGAFTPGECANYITHAGYASS